MSSRGSGDLARFARHCRFFRKRAFARAVYSRHLLLFNRFVVGEFSTLYIDLFVDGIAQHFSCSARVVVTFLYERGGNPSVRMSVLKGPYLPTVIDALCFNDVEKKMSRQTISYAVGIKLKFSFNYAVNDENEFRNRIEIRTRVVLGRGAPPIIK